MSPQLGQEKKAYVMEKVGIHLFCSEAEGNTEPLPSWCKVDQVSLVSRGVTIHLFNQFIDCAGVA